MLFHFFLSMHAHENSSQEPNYQQIQVETEANKLQVTLDDRQNDEKRYWGFHGGTIFPHITGCLLLVLQESNTSFFLLLRRMYRLEL